MNDCTVIQKMYARSLNEVLTPTERSFMSKHIDYCASCQNYRTSLERTVGMVSILGRIPAPADLALRIRVAVSQQRQKNFDHRWHAILEQTRFALRALMFPATSGLVSATFVFILVLSAMGTIQVEAQGPDIPNMLYSPPKLSGTHLPGSVIPMKVSSPVMIEAIVDAQGRLADYRILAGDDTKEMRRQLNQALLFTTFEPARTFGTPTQGRVVLTFSNIDVKG